MESTQAGAERHPDSALERIQRDHELSAALSAARLLQARLEMAGLDVAARRTRIIRDEVAEALTRLLDDEEAAPELDGDGPPSHPFTESPSATSGLSS